MIKWNDEYVQPDDMNPTREVLKKKLYNPEQHDGRSWWESLHHMIITSQIE